MERGYIQRRERTAQTCRAVGNGVSRTQHQSKNQPDHLTAVLPQCRADAVDGKSHTCNHAEAQRTQSRNHREIQTKKRLDRLHCGQVDARNQQNGGAGNSRQHHSGDRYRAGKENIKKRKWQE